MLPALDNQLVGHLQGGLWDVLVRVLCEVSVEVGGLAGLGTDVSLSPLQSHSPPNRVQL